MIQVLDPYYLSIAAIVTVCYQLSFFFVAYGCKFDKVTDFAGGSNFVVLVILTLVLGQTYYPRQILTTVLVSVWGLRIGLFLLYRILKTGQDERFNSIRESFLPFLGFWVFQMIWVFTGCFATILVNSNFTAANQGPLGVQDYIGLAMYVVGLIVEFEADRSKFSFKDSGSKLWCDWSVWGFSRHPNYFGEMLLWWGVWIICQPTFTQGWMYASLVGPIYTMTVLFFLSGMNLSEPQYANKFIKNDGYAEYRNKTSILIPLPTFVYGNLPHWVKAVFLFEWKMYEGKPDVKSEKSVV